MTAVRRRGRPIVLACPRCGVSLVTVVRGGHTRGGCGHAVYVPAAPAGAERTWFGSVRLACPACGRRFQSRARPSSSTTCRCGAHLPVPADPDRWYS